METVFTFMEEFQKTPEIYSVMLSVDVTSTNGRDVVVISMRGRRGERTVTVVAVEAGGFRMDVKSGKGKAKTETWEKAAMAAYRAYEMQKEIS